MRWILSMTGAIAAWACVWGGAASQAAEQCVFVQNGQAGDVKVVGAPWRAGPGYLECAGVDNYLFAGRAAGAGDVQVHVRMALLKAARSAASFMVGRGNFGFDGGGGQGMLISRGVFGRLRHLGIPYRDHITEGEPFDFDVTRKQGRLSIRINGREIVSRKDSRRAFGFFALRPWRATLRVYELSATADAFAPFVVPKVYRIRRNTPFEVPMIDISQETDRHVVIAQGTETLYNGHPTTLLLPDNRTMFCVYPLGHGGPGAVLRRSDDAGLTWSDPLDTPANWADSTNCPALYRLPGPDGVTRLFVFEGVRQMRQAMSADEGRTWTPFKENGLTTIMPFTAVIPLTDGRLLGGWNLGRATYTSVSADGGLTWSKQQCVCQGGGRFPDAWPCEPAFVRSPDGKQIACLMRENSRNYCSMAMFSNDEGATWSEPVELSREQSGDRHQPRYAHDGRLVIPFRDTAPGSPTSGHFCAWVGTYDDIAGQRPGQYRIKLLHSYAGGDCGYPGLELLPDGTFVATTYIKYREGKERQSVVSVRFKLSEIDAKAKALNGGQ